MGDMIDLNDILITSPGNTYYARVNGYYPIEGELDRQSRFRELLLYIYTAYHRGQRVYGKTA